ncbi:hypothetical protein [Crassaminicella profunda]|uniref:hypothetical protein n=1 Tax=Crassaminicella profunda TaxID=1286698 RepID=UPI001CA765EB|nr:hypothetical protein [Crassaminicella profunda]QZY57174.1 hypothetical protein K7H06_09745 [Crassaminicella profunda]
MAKFKTFLNDTNGLTERDFEKVTTGVLFILTVLSVLYRYLRYAETNKDIIYLVSILGSLFVIRKGISYFKPDRYYQNTMGDVNFDPNTNDTRRDIDEI